MGKAFCWVWVSFCNSISGGRFPRAAGRAQGWGTPCSSALLPAAALGLCSGDSRVFHGSSGTRDSPADAPRPSPRPPHHRGRQNRVRAASAPPRTGPRPLPCHTRTLPGGLSPPRDNRLLPHPPLVAFTISPSARRGVPKVLLAPRAPKRCCLQPLSERFGHGAHAALARSLTSLWLLLLLPLAQGGRGEARRAPRGPGMAPVQLEEAALLPAIISPAPNTQVPPCPILEGGSPCPPGRGLWALGMSTNNHRFPRQLFPGWRLCLRFVLSHPRQQSSSPGAGPRMSPLRVGSWPSPSPPAGPRALAVEQRCPSPRLLATG